jgi:transcriptional/translational regulatory protein YebC/TACO1
MSSYSNHEENIPKQVINRAIARGEPRTMGIDVSVVTYEIMLAGGVALVVYISLNCYDL